MKKISLLPLVLLGFSVCVYAKTFTIHGTQTFIDTSPATTVFDNTPTFSGTFDDTTKAYIITFQPFTNHITYLGQKATVTTSNLLLRGEGNKDIQRNPDVNINCKGSALICGSLPKGKDIHIQLNFSSTAEGDVKGEIRTQDDTALTKYETIYTFSSDKVANSTKTSSLSAFL